MMNDGEHLGYEELIKILSTLAVRLQRLEDATLLLFGSLKEQDEFLTLEIIKASLANETMKQKIPVKFHFTHARIKALDDSFKGLVNNLNERGVFDQKKETKKSIDVLGERVKHKDKV